MKNTQVSGNDLMSLIQDILSPFVIRHIKKVSGNDLMSLIQDILSPFVIRRTTCISFKVNVS